MSRRVARFRLEARPLEKYAGILVVIIAFVTGVLASALTSCVENVAQYYSELGILEKVYAINSVEEFENVLKLHPIVAIMFKSPQCRYCQLMFPHWLRIEKLQDKLGIGVYHVTWSPSVNELFRRYNVEDFPTFIVLVNGTEVARYVGPFKARNVTQAMLEWLLNVLKKIRSKTNVTGVTPSLSLEHVAGTTSYIPEALLVTMVIAGVATVFSPCALPLLAAYIASGTRSSRRTKDCVLCGLLAATGLTGILVIFAAATVVAVTIQYVILTGLALSLVAFGIVMALGTPMEAPLPTLKLGFAGFCLAYGIVTFQCIAPAVLTPMLTVLASGSLAYGILLTLVYAATVGIVLATLLTLATKLGYKRLEALLSKPLINIAMGALLACIGGYILAEVMHIV